MAICATERLVNELDESWDDFDNNGAPNFCHGALAKLRHRVAVVSVFLLFSSALGATYGCFVAVCELLSNASARTQAQKMLLGLAVGLVIVALTQMVGCLLICCAAYRRKLSVLKRSVIVCRLLLLTEISLAVLALFYQTTTRKETEQMADWRGFVFRYHRSARIHLQVDAIQTKLKCCGFSSYHDWEHNAYFACSSKTNGHCGVPTSCCKGQTPPWNCSLEIRSKASPGGREPSDVINTRGCLDLLIAWTKYNLILLGFCCLFLACLQLILFSAVREFRSQVFLQETCTDQDQLGVKPNDHDDPKAEAMTKRESESDRCRSVSVVTLQRNRDCEVKLISQDSFEKSQKMTAAGKTRTPHIRDV